MHVNPPRPHPHRSAVRGGQADALAYLWDECRLPVKQCDIDYGLKAILGKGPDSYLDLLKLLRARRGVFLGTRHAKDMATDEAVLWLAGVAVDGMSSCSSSSSGESNADSGSSSGSSSDGSSSEGAEVPETEVEGKEEERRVESNAAAGGAEEHVHVISSRRDDTHDTGSSSSGSSRSGSSSGGERWREDWTDAFKAAARRGAGLAALRALRARGAAVDLGAVAEGGSEEALEWAAAELAAEGKLQVCACGRVGGRVGVCLGAWLGGLRSTRRLAGC